MRCKVWNVTRYLNCDVACKLPVLFLFASRIRNMLNNSKGTFPFKLAFLIAIAILPQLISGFVFGVDLGTESFKVALVRPRLDVALNDASQRKTPTVVSYFQRDLLIGTDAKNLVSRTKSQFVTNLQIARSPSHVYTNIHRLLGRQYGDPEVEQAIKDRRFPYKLVEFQGGYGIYHDETITFGPEDILALLLSNAKETAAKNAGMAIKDCVITVPAFYTQFQRQAVLDAAKIAGVNVLSLLNDNTAVALNWGIERQFDSENYTNVVFYDMGATKTEATLVTYKSVQETKKNETIGQLTVQSVTWDKTLGGNSFDERLVLHFIKLIKEQHKVDVTEDSKAMAKLYREAQKVKEVLSANIDTFAVVEGLTSDIDFKVTYFG
jgi:hypoxia up-regulated 1